MSFCVCVPMITINGGAHYVVTVVQWKEDV